MLTSPVDYPEGPFRGEAEAGKLGPTPTPGVVRLQWLGLAKTTQEPWSSTQRISAGVGSCDLKGV